MNLPSTEKLSAPKAMEGVPVKALFPEKSQDPQKSSGGTESESLKEELEMLQIQQALWEDMLRLKELEDEELKLSELASLKAEQDLLRKLELEADALDTQVSTMKTEQHDLREQQEAFEWESLLNRTVPSSSCIAPSAMLSFAIYIKFTFPSRH